MNRRSIHISAFALALALCTSDGSAQQRSPSQSPQSTTPPPSTSPSTSPTPSQRQPSQPQATQASSTAVQSFVQEVAQSNQKEIELSRMAGTHAMSTAVKDYAKQLMSDHTKAMDKLRKYATDKNIPLRASTGTTTPSPSATGPSKTKTPDTTPSGRIEPPAGQPGKSSTPEPGRAAQTTPGQPERTEQPPNAGQPPRTDRSDSASAESPEGRELSAKTGSEFDKAFIQMMVDDHTKAVALFEHQHDAKLGDAALQSLINDELPVLRKHLNKARDIQKQLTSDTKAKTTPSGTPANR